MKSKMTLVLFFVISLGLVQSVIAGPIISAGPGAHPAISTMNIEAPEAGIDFPTDAPAPSFDYVLSLYNGVRIPLYVDSAELVYAEAGLDYPTDYPAPRWTKFQRVLYLGNESSYPVRLSLDINDNLSWKLTSGQIIDVNQIVKIVKAEAGVDYPTDAPYGYNQNFYIAVTADNNRIRL